MTIRCPHLDAYLDGQLSAADAQAYEAHALGCPWCAAALAAPLDPAFSAGGPADLRALADVGCPPDLLAHVLDAPDAPALFADGFRQLRAESCPPEVIEAALRTARRAPDRGARPARRTVRQVAAWTLGLAAALAVAVGLWPQAPALDPAGPAVAVSAPAPDEAPAPEPAPESVPTPDERPQAAALPSPQAPDPPAATAEPARPAPPPTPTASGTADDPAAPPLDALAAGPDTPSDDLPTEAEIADARRDLALAFRLVDKAQTRARDAVRDEAGALSETLDFTLPF